MLCGRQMAFSVWEIIFLVYLPGSKFAITSLSELNVFVFDKIKSNLLLQLFEVVTFPSRLLYQPWLLLCPFPLLFLPLTCRGAGVCWPWVVSCGSYLHRPFHLLRVPLAVKNWGGYELYEQPGKQTVGIKLNGHRGVLDISFSSFRAIVDSPPSFSHLVWHGGMYYLRYVLSVVKPSRPESLSHHRLDELKPEVDLFPS